MMQGESKNISLFRANLWLRRQARGTSERREQTETRKMKRLCLVIGLAGAFWATAVQAAVVQELNTNPGLTVNIVTSGGGFSGDGLAGIYNLKVDGVDTPSFCIDVFRLSPPGSQSYTPVSLASAPLSPAGPMGSAAAVDIEKLWAAYFGGATGSALEAAALQVAIWKDIGSYVGYTVVVNGDNASDSVVIRAGQMLASLSSLTAQASLHALVNDTYQNYVVPIPEPTTLIAGALLLLPFGASTLRNVRKNRAA
jgi:hypothetical protein